MFSRRSFLERDPRMSPEQASEVFQRERAHLFAVAYRMLGSTAEAEDVLQDAFLRFMDYEEAPDSARAFLTTVVVRLCLDQLKSARTRRESYVGPWLPEPLVSAEIEPLPPPDARAELAESLSIAFLVLLERLSPLERAAFLLREVFDEPFAEVARVLDTTEAACRQLVSRARAHIDANKPRHAASEEKKQALLAAFVQACASHDAAALGDLLAADAVCRTDGGGKVHAALKPIVGRDRVTRFILGVISKAEGPVTSRVVRINGDPGMLFTDERGNRYALVLTASEEAIDAVWFIVNPDKLAHVREPS